MGTRRPIPRCFVDVLAHQDRRAQHGVRKRREQDRSGDRSGGGVVHATDHQRTPHHNHCRLAEAVLLQPHRWRGVRGREQEAAEREADDRQPSLGGEENHHAEAHDVDDERVHRQPGAGDDARDHRVRRVEVAGIVLRVGADLEVEEIVHDVVRHVREDEPDRGDGEESPVGVRTAERGEQSTEPGRDQGHWEHTGTGEPQPLRHRVEGAFRRVGRGQYVQPLLRKTLLPVERRVSHAPKVPAVRGLCLQPP